MVALGDAMAVRGAPADHALARGVDAVGWRHGRRLLGQSGGDAWPAPRRQLYASDGW